MRRRKPARNNPEFLKTHAKNSKGAVRAGPCDSSYHELFSQLTRQRLSDLSITFPEISQPGLATFR
jgi:hypothetical protein